MSAHLKVAQFVNSHTQNISNMQLFLWSYDTNYIIVQQKCSSKNKSVWFELELDKYKES